MLCPGAYSTEEQSLDPEKSLRRAAAAFQSKTGDSFRENMDEEEPGRKLEMCIGVAFENAGVSLD